jgi:D-glycero-alpha-D-manno-heptose-7-phosphate kinase
MFRRVAARAPTRIDLAGGTVDLWPLYLLLDRPLTINAAINLEVEAVVEECEAPGWEIVSRDRGVSGRIPAGSSLRGALEAAPVELAFVVRLAHEFLATPARQESGSPGLRVVTDCRAPAGSGLGGSSTLGIALASALDRFVGRNLDAQAILHLTRAIETQVLAIPTGEQDYHPALRGGVLGLHYTVEGTRIESIAADARALESHLVLVYTGVSRSSGISNWDVFKRFLDGEAEVRDALQATSEAAHAMRQAILEGDWQAAGAALAREWEARKSLSPAVTDARIDRLIAVARDQGAQAGKVCGAGGGGCLILWIPDQGVRSRIERQMTAQGAVVLDFAIAPAGVKVTER